LELTDFNWLGSRILREAKEIGASVDAAGVEPLFSLVCRFAGGNKFSASVAKVATAVFRRKKARFPAGWFCVRSNPTHRWRHRRDFRHGSRLTA